MEIVVPSRAYKKSRSSSVAIPQATMQAVGESKQQAYINKCISASTYQQAYTKYPGSRCFCGCAARTKTVVDRIRLQLHSVVCNPVYSWRHFVPPCQACLQLHSVPVEPVGPCFDGLAVSYSVQALRRLRGQWLIMLPPNVIIRVAGRLCNHRWFGTSGHPFQRIHRTTGNISTFFVIC